MSPTCRRPYDEVHLGGGIASQAYVQSSALADLRRRMLLVMGRIVTSLEAAMPPPAQRIVTLRTAGRLPVPTLLDLAAVYVLDNKPLCQRILQTVWDADASAAGARCHFWY